MTDKLLYLVSEISVFSDFPEDETLCISEEDFLVSLREIYANLVQYSDKDLMVSKWPRIREQFVL